MSKETKQPKITDKYEPMNANDIPAMQDEVYGKLAPQPIEGDTKPPLGIMPEWRWKELRVEELNEAIKRYSEAGLRAPDEWLRELDNYARSLPTVKVGKTLDQIKDEIAKEYGHVNWSAVKNKFRMDSLDVSGLIAFCDEANKRFYAQSHLPVREKPEEETKTLGKLYFNHENQSETFVPVSDKPKECPYCKVLHQEKDRQGYCSAWCLLQDN